MFKYRGNLENWLENLRYLTENYDPYVPNIDSESFEQEPDDSMNSESAGNYKRSLSGSYENIWNCTTDFSDETKLNYGRICRVSFEFDDCVEISPVIFARIDFSFPNNIDQWKSDLMYDYSSEDDIDQEYASLEKINEEKGNTYSQQTQPFPIENTVDLRHGSECVRRPSFRSQTVHEFATGNYQQLVTFNDNNPIDLKGVTKLTYDGSTKKLNKNQFLRIYNDHMLLVTEKGGEEIIIDNLCQTDYKPISKKEVSIKKTSEDVCKIYKLQFDNVKEMNCAIIDLETYYGIERPVLAKLQTPEEKSQIRYKLLKLLGKRSSKDLLEKKGIIKNEPIFGNTLKHLYDTYKQEVPEFVLRIIKLIELPKNIDSVGLYRASGNLATIQKIRFNIDKNNVKILDEFKNDSDVLTGSLKLFFRELKEPLIPHKLFENLFKYIDVELTPKIGDTVKQLVNKMEKAHKVTLLTLLDHLLKVEAHSEENRMDAYNISIVWGPTLIWPPDNCHDNILLSHTNANKVVELLLNVYKISSSPLLKHEPSPLNINEESEEGAAKDKNALMLALNENLIHNLRKTNSKDNIMKSTDSLTKHRSPMEKDIKFDLEVLSASTKEKVPEFVVKTIPLIERGINMEFLYKKSGNSDKLEKIRKKICKKGSNLNSMEKYNPHDLASALKNFFVDLKEPIIPKHIFNKLVLATDERIEITKLRNTKKELTMAEIPHRETLDYLLKHLVNVSRHEESNKMSKHNIAVEWGPIISRHFVENHEVSVGCSIQVFETLLQIYDNKTAINLETEWNQNIDVRLGRNVEGYLGRSPEYTSNQVLPPIVVAKRRPKVVKNESSLYRVSKFISNTLSLYDNVQYPSDTKDEATILDNVQVKKSVKSPEDRTKL